MTQQGDGTEDDVLLARGRRSMSEAFLWRELRKGPDGLHFLRHRSAGKYVLDYYCPDARLAVEFDGCGETDPEARDAERKAWLASAGIELLVIDPCEVIDRSALTASGIFTRVRKRLPHGHPATLAETA